MKRVQGTPGGEGQGRRAGGGRPWIRAGARRGDAAAMVLARVAGDGWRGQRPIEG